ncbi:pyridoxine 5-phosphate synthase [Sulfurovum lithotrophicum]|uniref:Pyridoxine 5'-phosphate synthase n=1 Tax=Sulfurovum lithotrophicum TaxID=206403 RepID=A0A7U4M0E8_9BACT|nr:pyridoxine 5'-phosphate synthase [Sulfurovum lithotrophicum]AKF24565.1 pyridoxine 5-phosphate synthase [Sulfurovum lithotrophicum]
MLLGVNIDHIAVLREARKVADPDPLDALGICRRAGADQITIHLREDRRHMHDIDAKNIIELSALPVNLECATEPSMIDITCGLRPHRVTLVPEKREEVTTEGGLAVTGEQSRLKEAISRLQKEEIEVSLFIDPASNAVQASADLGVEWIEFHTGKYANIYAMLYSNLTKTHHSIPELKLPRSVLKKMLEEELESLSALSAEARVLGLKVAAGHGLNYHNVQAVAKIEEIEELNIGQSIIARSVYTGLEQAILDMKAALIK